MRKEIPVLFTAIALFTTSTPAQVTYTNYVDTSSLWHVELVSGYFDFGCGSFATQYSSLIFFVDGDTMIDGNWYHKLYTNRKDSTVCMDDVTINTSTSYTLGLREQLPKSIYSINGFGDELLWDFDISLGTTLPGDCVINLIDTVFLGDTPLQRFHCPCFANNMAIEGVGASSGFLDVIYCAVGIEYSKKLVCYKKQGDIIQVDSLGQCAFQQDITTQIESIYEEGSGFHLFPNPASDFVSIQISNADITSEFNLIVYDILGVKLKEQRLTGSTKVIDLSHLPQGIYIVEFLQNDIRLIQKLIMQ